MRSVLLTAFRIPGLALAFVLQIAWLVQTVPLAVKILPAAVFGLSAARPALGLMVLAGLGPMANAISYWSQSPLPGIRLLEQLVLAVVSGAGLRWWFRSPGTRLAEPASLMAASAIASFIAVQPALLLPRMPDVTVRDHLRALFWNGDYFLRSALWDPLFFAALTVEGLALAVTAERIIRRNEHAAVGTVRMALAGHAGVAAVNLQQLVGAAIRAGDVWRELMRIVRDTRISLFYDVNAAGSVFLLNLLSGVGLLVSTRRARWEILPLLALLGLGLWMAGSRSAMLALAVTLVGLLGVAAWRRRGVVRWAVVASMAGVLAAGILLVLSSPASRNLSAGSAAAIRRVLAQTSLNMWRAAPVFGVGVGRFYEESSRYGADALQRELGYPMTNENAHNYFLQVLATEGIIGLASVLLVLGAVLVPSIRAGPGAPRHSMRSWLIAGVIGYLLTWLTGHPQLVPEAAFAFWPILGVLAALTAPVVPNVWRGLVVVAAVVLVGTAPARVAHATREADFEHVAVGLSQWQPEIDGVRYRIAGRSFVLYLPADGTSVDLPLRRAPNTPDPLVVTISADRRTLYEPLVSGDAWQQIRLQLPRTNSRFARVDFEIRPSRSADGPVPAAALYVGKTVRR